MICSKCGKNSSDDAKFCENCGTKLTEAIYSVKGMYGKHIYVYQDKCIIIVNRNLGAFFTGNYTDGEKTIYYSDCIGVQFKKSTSLIGYLQLETASSIMNNTASNFFNENTFTFDTSVVSNEYMETVYLYIKKQIEQLKKKQNTPSIADELLKYKTLLDNNAITQEEFDNIKKNLLNL